ncbi:DNA cytosine methyltransferase, partial [Campylobacter volucris]|uniref:DNA cytosine methyltransferase n=1 Tax=Campylobacter volucris TaxID=1031542 RepID=UPI00189FEEDC
NGFEQNKNFKTIIGVDCNKFALETFKYNHPNSKIIHGDLKDVFVKKYIINEAQKNGINMIIGGPPCQGFSSKGKNLGLQDERNFLFKEYLEIVK